MTAYYNEFDPYAAHWLRNLIAAGHISPGVVDERSIEDVVPSDLEEFTQCHFFAGIGVWSLALRRAGWPDDRPVWTGSCPCQPFSAAGAQAGFSDPRHLWPTFAWLIKQRRPAIVFGEQVASKAVEPWVDLVHADMEALGYAFGGVPFPSAGVGAPHIRDRLYWVGHLANTEGFGRQGQRGCATVKSSGRTDKRGKTGGVADADSLRFESAPVAGFHNGEHHVEPCGGAERLGNPDSESTWGDAGTAYSTQIEYGSVDSDRDRSRYAGYALASGRSAGPTNGFWQAADWLGCRDGKWRPVEPGTSPLANGAASRVGRLRAYGNAINAEAARVFIEAVMECQP